MALATANRPAGGDHAGAGGLGVGQWPYLVPPGLTIAGTAAPPGTLSALLVVIAAGMAILAPSLWLLLRVFKGRRPALARPPA